MNDSLTSWLKLTLEKLTSHYNELIRCKLDRLWKFSYIAVARKDVSAGTSMLGLML